GRRRAVHPRRREGRAATAPEERAAAVLREARRVVDRAAALARRQVGLALGDVDVAVGAARRVALEPEVALDEGAEGERLGLARVGARDRLEGREGLAEAVGEEAVGGEGDAELAVARAHGVGAGAVEELGERRRQGVAGVDEELLGELAGAVARAA